MKVIVTGGGTGGHIYPAVAIAEKLKKDYKGVEILYLGAKLGMEKTLVPQAGLPFKQIDVAPLNKKISLKTLKAVFTLVKGLFQSAREIKRFKPDVIIGTGGYVAGPVVMMGALLGVPTMIHEQNAFPGMTNKILSRFVDKVLVTFEEAKEHFKQKDKIVYTGLPVLDAFFSHTRQEARHKLKLADDVMVVMTVGGSNGALKVNEVMMNVYKSLADQKKIKFIHVSGKRYYERIEKGIKDGIYQVGDNFELVDFMKQMPLYLKATDLVISRAGASTINEIIASQTPSVIIPSPNVANNHQFFNAKVVDKNGMGLIISESELTAPLMVNTIMNFYEEPSKLEIMRKNCEKIDIHSALDRISEEVSHLLGDNQLK